MRHTIDYQGCQPVKLNYCFFAEVTIWLAKFSHLEEYLVKWKNYNLQDYGG